MMLVARPSPAIMTSSGKSCNGGMSSSSGKSCVGSMSMSVESCVGSMSMSGKGYNGSMSDGVNREEKSVGDTVISVGVLYPLIMCGMGEYISYLGGDLGGDLDGDLDVGLRIW